MIDEYTHNDNKLFYIIENILGPTEHNPEYEELLKEFNSQLTCHCHCEQHCEHVTCECIQLSGGANYSLHSNGILKYISESKNIEVHPIIECNNLCHCLENCTNRLVQYGPINSLIVKLCDKSKGFGLFSKHAISKGTFICEYAGEILTKSEALKRHKLNLVEGKMNYIYCLKEHCVEKVKETFIDPSNFGNIGRYINHSCDPNCYIVPVRVNTPIPKLAIFALKDIPSNSELTYDYGSGEFDINSLAAIKNKKKCLCNSRNCKQWMPYESY